MKKDILIASSSSTRINLSEYAASSLAITVQAGVHYRCIYDKSNFQNFDIVFHLQRDAILDCVLLITEGELLNINLAISLEGEYAQANVRGLYALSGSQQLAITTSQHHKAPHATSNLIIKGMLNDHAKADYRGNILVDQVAKYTNAVQENKNILLSRTAHAQSIPCLEVLTNDVQCKHGSAVGYLDEQSLFYVQSRALDAQTARQLLLHGFFIEIIDALDASMISDIYEIIKKKSM
ncbi:MAG: SufD family Fe-S cluster assembly protein [Candidatus Babeliales bacterium]|nr:SufD family Fe-S cluster assembly protein [Candidatus Babeliales bacterium]